MTKTEHNSILIHLTIAILIVAIWTGTTSGAREGAEKCARDGVKCLEFTYRNVKYGSNACVRDHNFATGESSYWCATAVSGGEYTDWDWWCGDCEVPSGMTTCPNMKAGDASGGKEIMIGSYTLGDCLSECKKRKGVMGITTTNLVDDTQSGDCYCEFSVTERPNSSRKYKTCFLKGSKGISYYKPANWHSHKIKEDQQDFANWTRKLPHGMGSFLSFIFWLFSVIDSTKLSFSESCRLVNVSQIFSTQARFTYISYPLMLNFLIV